MKTTKYIDIYLECHIVCPLVRIGTPIPSPASECVPPGTKGGTHSSAGEGVGGPNSDDWRTSLALCILGGEVSFCCIASGLLALEPE